MTGEAGTGPVPGCGGSRQRRHDEISETFAGPGSGRSGEAILLAERLVMTARPGRIKTEVLVPLPRPRRYTMRAAPEFIELKARLIDTVRDEALLASDWHAAVASGAQQASLELNDG